MPEFQPLLRDRSVLLITSLNSTCQALATLLSENGADLMIACDDVKNAEHMANNLNTVREIHDYFGRVEVCSFGNVQRSDPKVFLTSTAVKLGGLDAVIDCSIVSAQLGGLKAQISPSDLQTDIEASRKLASAAIEVFSARRKGRVVLMWQDPTVTGTESLGEPLSVLLQSVAFAIKSRGVTANALALGYTEDFLATRVGGKIPIKASLAELQKTDPSVGLLEPQDVANLVVMLLSGLSNALSGHVLTI